MDNLYAKSKELLQSGEIEQLLILLNDDELTNQKDEFLYELRAEAHLAEKNYEMAVKYAQESIKINNDLGTAWMTMGMAHFYKGEFEKARMAFSEVIRILPENSDAYNNMGACYANEANDEALDSAIGVENTKGQNVTKNIYELANDYYKKALELDSTNQLYIDNIEINLNKLAKNNKPEHLVHYINDNIAKGAEQLQVTLSFPYKPYYLILDQIIRILILYYYLNHTINFWGLFFLNLLLFVIEAVIADKLKRKLTAKLDQHKSDLYKTLEIKYADFQNVPDILLSIYFFVGLIFSYWLFYHLTTTHQWYFHILYLLGSLLGGFSFIIVLMATDIFSLKFGIKSIRVNRIITSNNKNINVTEYFPNFFKIANNRFKEKVKLDPSDENDAKIVDIESEVKTIGTRVEAYLLESILLGGLAFSGFLTVVSSDNIKSNVNEFRFFCDNLRNCFLKIQDERLINCLSLLKVHFGKTDLFILVMLLCLASSVFFLLVLTLRIRYMDLSLNIDHLIRSMTTFNAKEEEFLKIEMEFKGVIEDKYKERLNSIRNKIDDDITSSVNILKELNPIVNLMTFCRNIAVFLFYTVLIVSGFFFSPMVSLTIFLIAIFVLVYRFIETIRSVEKLRGLISEKYIKKAR